MRNYDTHKSPAARAPLAGVSSDDCRFKGGAECALGRRCNHVSACSEAKRKPDAELWAAIDAGDVSAVAKEMTP